MQLLQASELFMDENVLEFDRVQAATCYDGMCCAQCCCVVKVQHCESVCITLIPTVCSSQ